MFKTDHYFNNVDGLRMSNCGMSEQNLQNLNASNYLLKNYRPACPMTKAIDLATEYPTMNYTGSHQVGIDGCNINTNSELHITDLTRPSCKITLQERPFLTVPYLGRGRCDIDAESDLHNCLYTQNKKSINPSSEICYSNYTNTPMIPTLEASVQNPAHLVEDVAAEGWIRGGLPSREYTKTVMNNKNQGNNFQHNYQT